MEVLRITKSGSLAGTVTVPGDKSISHRALMLGALAEGDTEIENFLAGEDCLATLRCLQALGIKISNPTNGKVIVHGQGLTGLSEPLDVLDAANSGTTMRLLLGILAGQPFFSVITGDESLRKRPMARVTAPLIQMGAKIQGRHNGNLAPLSIQGGGLQSIHYSSPIASAQVKSAVLLAGLFADGWTSVNEPSISRDHTERMLKYLGAKVEISKKTVKVQGKPRLTGRKIIVPGDISSASFFLVAAAIVPGSEVTVSGVGINPTRSGILDVLKQMDAKLELNNIREISGEPVADIKVKGGTLRGVKIDGDLIPRLIDEIPVLAVAGSVAKGETVIRDAAELKVKESDRIAVMVNELKKFGVEVEELSDGMVIYGGNPLKGAHCESYGDHRIAMAMVIAGLAASGETLVKNTGCINVSFPGFIEVLNFLRVE